MAILISAKVLEKLQTKHSITAEDVEQCFATRESGFLIDTREDHKTDPQTLWFISDTYMGVHLKVCFIPSGCDYIVKTAYPANKDEQRIYNKFAKPLS